MPRSESTLSAKLRGVIFRSWETMGGVQAKLQHKPTQETVMNEAARITQVRSNEIETSIETVAVEQK